MAKNEKKKSSTPKDRTGAMKAGLKKTRDELKAGMEESVDKSRQAIQKRPLTAVGVAAGIRADHLKHSRHHIQHKREVAQQRLAQ